MKPDTFKELLVDELLDIYDAEKQLVVALPKMAAAANHAELKAAFNRHLNETNGHVQRIETIFSKLGEKSRSKPCKAMKSLIAEGEQIANVQGDSQVRDAALIGAAQKVEHYEVSAYGSARAFAEMAGQPEIAQILETTLDEENAADEALSRLAETAINPQSQMTGRSQDPFSPMWNRPEVRGI